MLEFVPGGWWPLAMKLAQVLISERQWTMLDKLVADIDDSEFTVAVEQAKREAVACC